MATSIRTPQSKFNDLEKILTSTQKELSARFEERMADVSVEREPDDEAAEANRNYSRDLTLITLERERQTLKEINHALDRLKKGQYGVCSVCGVQIPQARLRAIPWARICVHCADRGSARSSER